MSIYQKGVWLVKGMSGYTKNGYLAAEKHFNPRDLDVDATGKTFMITGANSGIGKSLATSIAKKGGKVHMICRNEARANKAREEIVEESKNEDVHVHILDTSKLKDVYKFVESFKAANSSLNVLVNNAGCMVNERQKNEDGLELNFATNVMGTYILSVGLFPLLKQSEKPRVIIVSSGGMLTAKLNAKDLQLEKERYDGTTSYAQQKRQQVIFTEEWAKIHPEIHFSSMHPGWADTPAVQTSMPGFYDSMKNRLRSPEQGADTLVWLCLADAALLQKSGQFFQDRKPVSTHLPLAWTKESKEDRETLMKKLEEIAESVK